MVHLVDPSRYQFVLLDCPYDTWSSAVTRQLFSKIIDLKLQGYLMSYPYGALPVDTTDFVGVHHVICEKKEGELQPVMAYKSITLTRCNMHHLTFPATSVLQASKAHQHVRALNKILLLATLKKTEISYDGSWTMSPEIRKNKIQSELLKEIMIAINVQYHLNHRILEIIGFGLLRFKTEQFFKKIGYELVLKGSEPLPSLSMPSLQNEQVVLMHLKQFSNEALAIAKKFQYLWDNRIEISDPNASIRIGLSRKAA